MLADRAIHSDLPASVALSRHAGRVPALDGLRGLAILLVIPHNSDVFPPTHGWLFPFAAIAHSGWIGVQLFFVLSGFLISGNLLDSRAATNYYSAFFGRRVLRIFPLYFLTLAFFLLVLPAIAPLSPDILDSYRHQLWLWIFLSNWTQPSEGTVYWFSHFWSLAIEEQFYLIWPFIIACVGDRKLLWLCAGTVACAFLVRVFMFAAGAQPEMIYMFSICRMDALALGAAAAVVIRRRDVVDVMRRHSTAMILCTLGILLAGAIVSHVYDTHDVLTITVGYTILAIGFAVLVLVAGAGASRRLASIIQRLLSLAALRSVGKYSFAMYVLHLPIELSLDPWLLTAVKPVGAAYPILYSAIIAVLSYVAAFLSYQLLEKHCLRLKRFLVPHAPSGSAATA